MIGFIIGFVLGGWFGVMIAATLAMSRDYDRKHRNEEDAAGMVQCHRCGMIFDSNRVEGEMCPYCEKEGRDDG